MALFVLGKKWKKNTIIMFINVWIDLKKKTYFM